MGRGFLKFCFPILLLTLQNCRNTAGSGLNIDVTGIRGIIVKDSFTPSTVPSGDILVVSKRSTADEPMGDDDDDTDIVKAANVIKPIPGQQAAVTFGAGLATQALNDALAKSGLFSMGAAEDVSTSDLFFLIGFALLFPKKGWTDPMIACWCSWRLGSDWWARPPNSNLWARYRSSTGV
jgi:hypothetical protein